MMRRSLAMAAAGALLIGGIGCGGGEPALGAPLPVSDGTWFRYADEGRRSSKFPRTTTIRFEDVGGGTFHYIEIFRVESRDRPDMGEDNPSPVLLVREDGIVLGFADEDLKPNALGNEQVMNRLAKIWLSRENRVPGAEVRLEGFPDSAAVSEARSWKKWTVAVVAPYGYEYYFDRDTGYLVGWTSEGGDTWVLDETNAIGLR